MGWLQSQRPVFGRVPESVLWFLDSLGLTAFVASIGINAGPGFVQGVRASGLALLIYGAIVCTIPYIITILAGRFSSDCIRASCSVFVQEAAPPLLRWLPFWRKLRVACLFSAMA
jgi:uncharacterized transporter YbjL